MARKLAGPLGVHPNKLLRIGSLTEEFSWETTISPPSEELLVDLHLSVTLEEQKNLTEYLEFLRFKQSLAAPLKKTKFVDLPLLNNMQS
jgi:hypothetical protein